MKVLLQWISRLFVMAVLCLTLHAEDKKDSCESVIKVRRDTTHNSSVGQRLEILCPVTLCTSSPPTITWLKYSRRDYKLVNMSDSVKTQWKTTNDKENEGISFLFFENLSTHDSGRYQCQIGHSVSHSIIVHITESTVDDNTTLQNIKNITSPYNHDKKQLWLYLYSAAGILGIVIIVIVISVLSMQGCNGKSKIKAQSETLYMDIPMVEQPSHHSSNQALSRGSPPEPPSRQASRKKKSPAPVPAQRLVYEQRERSTARNGHEEENSVLYVALNHQQLTAATSRPRMVVEESSEYAAIRVP